MLTTPFGPLLCRMVDKLPTGQRPKLGLVLCHGFGATGQDLVPLADSLLAHPELGRAVRCVFPEAPLQTQAMGSGARSWWPIDVPRIQQAMLEGQLEEFLREEPPGMAQTRRRLHACIDAFCLHAGLGYDQLILGGFSQGGLLAADLSLRLDEAPAGLVILSGILMCADSWRKRIPRRAGLPVFQSHGLGDPILPLFLAEKLRDMLGAGGMSVTFLSFQGGHEVTPVVATGLSGFVGRTLASRET